MTRLVQIIRAKLWMHRRLQARKALRPAKSQAARQGHSTSWARRSEQARKVMGV